MIRTLRSVTIFVLTSICLLGTSCMTMGSQEHQIVMRDLSILKAGQVTWGPLGLETDSKHFDWDEVLSADLADPADQATFDRYLVSLGRPLYLLRRRLLNRDWIPLQEIAEPLYRKQLNERTNQKNKRVHYLVALAAFHSRLADGQRAGALASFLRACEIRNTFAIELPELAKVDFSARQLRTRFTPRILPVWFEGETQFAVEKPEDFGFSGPAEDWTDGTLLYALTLSIHSGDQAKAKSLWAIAASRSGELMDSWQPILAYQMELLTGQNGSSTKALRESYRQLPLPAQAVAEYCLVSNADRSGEDRDVVALDLLRIAANYGNQAPHLAAATHYRAIQILESQQRLQESHILRAELLQKYANTYHGRLLNQN